MSVEFDYFIASNKKWWCHFDDDNYVNVPQLVKVLQRYNPLSDWYLGKSSIKQPLEINERDSKVRILTNALFCTVFLMNFIFYRKKSNSPSELVELAFASAKHSHSK